MRVPAHGRWLLPVLVGLCLVMPDAADAQLRPLEPMDWRALAPARGFAVSIGAGAFANQRASRAGSVGDLLELGNFSISWTTGRVTLEGAGTIVRRHREQRRLNAAAEGVVASDDDAVRQDAGDMRISTIVRLSPETHESALALRFGTRLPTTDDRIGLDRDQTDFFALLGGRAPFGGAAVFAEAGVSINGTRLSNQEQADVLVFSAGGEYAVNGVRLHALVVGRDDLHRNMVRGSEDLSELRAGVRIGHTRWVQLSIVRGIAAYSPQAGVLLSAGVQLLGASAERP